MNNSHYLCLTWNAKLKVKVKHAVGVHDSEFCSNAISQTPRCNRFSVDGNHLVEKISAAFDRWSGKSARWDRVNYDCFALHSRCREACLDLSHGWASHTIR